VILQSKTKDVEVKKGMFMFEVFLPSGEIFYLAAPTPEERLQWLKSLNIALIIFAKRSLRESKLIRGKIASISKQTDMISYSLSSLSYFLSW